MYGCFPAGHPVLMTSQPDFPIKIMRLHLPASLAPAPARHSRAADWADRRSGGSTLSETAAPIQIPRRAALSCRDTAAPPADQLASRTNFTGRAWVAIPFRGTAGRPAQAPAWARGPEPILALYTFCKGFPCHLSTTGLKNKLDFGQTMVPFHLALPSARSDSLQNSMKQTSGCTTRAGGFCTFARREN
jgi:hypothetical protein